MSDTRDEQPRCVGCDTPKDAEDLYEYPDGARCYDCCGRREREAADAWQQMSLAERIAFGAAPGWPSLPWSAQEPKRPGWWWFRASPKCKAFIVEVRAGEAGLFHAFMPWGRTYLYRTTSSEGEWSGPLPEPESASDAPTTAND